MTTNLLDLTRLLHNDVKTLLNLMQKVDISNEEDAAGYMQLTFMVIARMINTSPNDDIHVHGIYSLPPRKKHHDSPSRHKAAIIPRTSTPQDGSISVGVILSGDTRSEFECTGLVDCSIDIETVPEQKEKFDFSLSFSYNGNHNPKQLEQTIDQIVPPLFDSLSVSKKELKSAIIFNISGRSPSEVKQVIEANINKMFGIDLKSPILSQLSPKSDNEKPARRPYKTQKKTIEELLERVKNLEAKLGEKENESKCIGL